MPRWISHKGEWCPAKEKVGLVNVTDEVKEIDGKKIQPGEPFIYEGPDRAALFELWKTKVDKLGINFKHDPDLLARIRSLGYSDIDSYLKDIGWDEEKATADFKKHAAEIKSHEIERRAKEIEILGGGKDFAGHGQDVYGGFGEPKNI